MQRPSATITASAGALIDALSTVYPLVSKKKVDISHGIGDTIAIVGGGSALFASPNQNVVASHAIEDATVEGEGNFLFVAGYRLLPLLKTYPPDMPISLTFEAQDDGDFYQIVVRVDGKKSRFKETAALAEKADVEHVLAKTSVAPVLSVKTDALRLALACALDATGTADATAYAQFTYARFVITPVEGGEDGACTLTASATNAYMWNDVSIEAHAQGDVPERFDLHNAFLQHALPGLSEATEVGIGFGPALNDTGLRNVAFHAGPATIAGTSIIERAFPNMPPSMSEFEPAGEMDVPDVADFAKKIKMLLGYADAHSGHFVFDFGGGGSIAVDVGRACEAHIPFPAPYVGDPVVTGHTGQFLIAINRYKGAATIEPPRRAGRPTRISSERPGVRRVTYCMPTTLENSAAAALVS